MPRNIDQQKRNASKRTMQAIRALALAATSFTFGTVINLSSSLMGDHGQGRMLSQATTDATLRGPRPQSDMTNGRGWIYPSESDLMKQRLQALDNRLKSLQTTPPARSDGPRTDQDIEFCRNKVFTTVQPPVTEVVLDRTCNDPKTFRFNVCHDLADFTGLTMDEVVVRMARMKQFHLKSFVMAKECLTELSLMYLIR